MEKLIVFGCGKQAKNIVKILKYEGILVSGFCVDKEYHSEETYLGLPLYETENFLANFSPEEYQVFLPLSAIDKCNFRKEKFLQFDEKGFEFYSYISKWSLLHTERENIGRNAYIGHSAKLGPDVIIGDNCCISECTLIGHDAVIGAHCFFASGAIIGASSTIGERVTIGLGAVIREGTHIAEGSVLGMGIKVHRDIKKSGTYIFSPLEEAHFTKKAKKK